MDREKSKSKARSNEKSDFTSVNEFFEAVLHSARPLLIIQRVNADI